MALDLFSFSLLCASTLPPCFLSSRLSPWGTVGVWWVAVVLLPVAARTSLEVFKTTPLLLTQHETLGPSNTFFCCVHTNSRLFVMSHRHWEKKKVVGSGRQDSETQMITCIELKLVIKSMPVLFGSELFTSYLLRKTIESIERTDCSRGKGKSMPCIIKAIRYFWKQSGFFLFILYI